MGSSDRGENVDQIKRDFLAPEELAELQARTEHWMREHVRGSHRGTNKNLQNDDPWFEEQLKRGRQVGLIETLLEDALEPATAAFFDRVPGESKAIMPHYDAIGHRKDGCHDLDRPGQGGRGKRLPALRQGDAQAGLAEQDRA